MRTLLALLLALSCGVASAFTNVNSQGAVTLVRDLNTVKFVDGTGQTMSAIGRSFGTLGGTGGSSTIGMTEGYTAAIGGENIAVVSSRTLSNPEIAVAVVALGAAAYGGCAVGTAISNYTMGGTSNGSRVSCNVTDWLFDAGVAPQTATVPAWHWNGTGNYASSDAAALSHFGFVPNCKFVDSSTSVRYYGTGTLAQGNCSGDSGTSQQSGTFVQSTCHASIDALNPAYNIPEGAAPSPDGLCPTGRYNSATPAQVSTLLQANGNRNALGQVATDVLAKNGTITTASPRTVSGPASATGQPTTTTVTTGGNTTTTTTTPVTNYTYNTNVVTYVYNNSVVQTGPSGTTTTTSSDPPKDPCGLPGSPACKIDESGTPVYVAPSTAPITDVRDAQSQKINDTMAPITDPGFGFLGAPPVASCSAFVLPNSMGSIDPCDQMETVRTIMAYVWALSACWICFGMVKRTIAG